MLLFSAFALRAGGHCYVSQKINRFSKSFQVANIKNAGFSKLKTRFSRFETRFVWGLSIVPVCLITQRSLSLPDLSRKIERSLLAGYKLINNNFFKHRSFQGCLILEIRRFGYSDQSLRAKKGKGKKRVREKDRNRFAKEGPDFGFCECVKNI